MTSRSELQGKPIKDLREIAASVGVEANGLQKAKLIEAILGSADFVVSDEPAPIDLPTAVPAASVDAKADVGDAETVSEEAAPEAADTPAGDDDEASPAPSDGGGQRDD